MAALDLLSLEPNKISRDLSGVNMLIFSSPGKGKSTWLATIPNNLILAFEPGLRAIPGVYSVPIATWGEMRQYLTQLRKPEVRERFSSISIDTVSLSLTKCEEYVIKREEAKANEKNPGERKIYTSVRDISWGQGWSMVPKEFGDVMREIVSLGYSLKMAAHEKTRSIVIGKDQRGEDITTKISSPDLDEKSFNLVNTILDIVAYIDIETDENGNENRYLYTGGREDIVSKTRYKYLAKKIPLSYPDVLQALNDALDKQAELDGAEVMDNSPTIHISQKIPFEDVMSEARNLFTQLMEQDKETNGPEISAIVQKYLGDIKLSQAKAHQQDLVEVVVAEMRELLK